MLKSEVNPTLSPTLLFITNLYVSNFLLIISRQIMPLIDLLVQCDLTLLIFPFVSINNPKAKILFVFKNYFTNIKIIIMFTIILSNVS